MTTEIDATNEAIAKVMSKNDDMKSETETLGKRVAEGVDRIVIKRI